MQILAKVFVTEVAGHSVETVYTDMAGRDQEEADRFLEDVHRGIDQITAAPNPLAIGKVVAEVPPLRWLEAGAAWIFFHVDTREQVVIIVDIAY